jgi:tRNA(fMet)-specific endonuclease VapC
VILDTDGLSAIADGDTKLAQLLQPATEIAVPVVVLGEFQYGIRLSRHRMRYESLLTEFLATCRVLVVDERTAGVSAEVRHELKRSGHPIPGNDTWIAALARQHNYPVVTPHHHFNFVPGLTCLNW